ncbi:MAG: hypothetical protein RLY43_2267 [Bacteroidota bacterium]|jgi:glycosyltransferase involved in cell wall biosynthesis
MILYVAYVDSSSSGGSIRVLETILNQLDQNSVVFNVVFVYGEKGIIGSRFSKNCYYLNSENGKGYKSIFKFYSLYKKISPKIVHLIDPVYWVQLCLLLLKTKSVLHIHGAYWNRSLKFRIHALWILSRICINRFIVITHGTRDELIKNHFASSLKIDILYNAVELKNSNIVSDEEVRLKYNIPNDAKVIGSIGRIVQARGFEDLIRTLNFLDNKWHALIIGDGDFKPELIKLALKLNVLDRVHITGFVDNVEPLYRIMDIYGFFARYESFGLALADAMLLKVPVFGLIGAGEYFDSRNPLITSSNSTFIKRPDNTNQWRDETDDTLSNFAKLVIDFEIYPSKYVDKSKVAYDDVVKKFNPNNQFIELMNIYKKLTNVDGKN